MRIVRAGFVPRIRVAQGDVDIAAVQADPIGESLWCNWADRIHPTAQGRVEIGHSIEAFRRDPAAIDSAGAAGARQVVIQRCPFGDRRQNDQREQRVVKFVGVADDGPGFVGHLGDGG